jgi:uncharacterized membrane protein YkvI
MHQSGLIDLASDWLRSVLLGCPGSPGPLIGQGTIAGRARKFRGRCCFGHQTRRPESLIAGALAGPIAIVPGMLFYVAMLARYPDIRDVSVPVQYLLAALDIPWFAVTTQIVLFGTLVKTGVGIVHGFNERLIWTRKAASPQVIRAIRIAVPLTMSAFAILLAARVGLVDLIAKGYGFLAWVIIAIYVVPVLAVGLPQLFSVPQKATAI